MRQWTSPRTIPTSFVTYAVDWSHYNINQGYYRTSWAYLNDVQCSAMGSTGDYIIGTVAMDGHSEEQYPHVYVSTDGWVVAYYLRDISSGWLLPWYYYSGGPISTTTLKEVVAEVCTQIGGTTTGLKYYDFRHPNATKMMIIIESTTGTNFFTVTIPTDFTVYRVDWSHWCSVCSEYKKSHRSDVYLDGGSFNTISDCNNCFSCGSFAPSVEFINGIEHKIEITTSKDTPIIGLVIEYEE